MPVNILSGRKSNPTSFSKYFKLPARLETGLTFLKASSILRLPNELLCLVFTDVASDEMPRNLDLYWGTLSERDVRLGFLRLSEVCKQFRAVLLSMPALWASVAFIIPETPGKLALARSGSMPLDIPVGYSTKWVSFEETGDVQEVYRRLLAATLKLAPRIWRLSAEDLQLPRSQHRRTSQCKFPLLEDIDLYYELSGPVPSNFVEFRADAPKLKRAKFAFEPDSDIAFFNEFERVFSINSSTLVSLTVRLDAVENEDTLRPVWLADLLQHSPSLRDLSLVLRSASSPPVLWNTLFNGRDVHLMHLRSVELEGGAAANWPSFFNHIVATPPARCILSYENFIGFHTPLDAMQGHSMVRFAKGFAHLLQRPSCDALVMKFRGERYDTMRLAILPSFCDPDFHDVLSEYPHYPDDAAQIVQLESTFSCGDEDDDALDREIMDALVPTLANNKFKQLVIETPRPHVWPYILQLLVSACATVTDLAIRRPWITSESHFRLFNLPSVLPALKTVYITFDAHPKDGDVFHRQWEEFLAWLTVRAAASTRISQLYILGHWPRRLEGDDDCKEWDKDMCIRAADFVDDLVDKRTEYRDISWWGT